MRLAIRLAACLSIFTLFLIASTRAESQTRNHDFSRISARARYFSGSASRDIGDVSRARARTPRPKSESHELLYQAIIERLGKPYLSRGIDDRGYDCSGFVWRVYQEAGIDFRRSSARSLWAAFPEATEDEQSQFGTLVFFEGLNHVGIVRDAYSFYHVSSSRGVVRSFFSGYWGDRVAGFRRIARPRRNRQD